jgi:hypothetical protein
VFLETIKCFNRGEVQRFWVQRYRGSKFRGQKTDVRGQKTDIRRQILDASRLMATLFTNAEKNLGDVVDFLRYFTYPLSYMIITCLEKPV